MRYEDLCWRGVHAKDLGVIVVEQVCYKRPALRLETVTVAGRSGTLTISQTPTWDVVPYTPGLAIRPGADREAVFDWLQGSGRVIFGSMPDSAFDATITGQIDVTEHVPGHPAGYLMLAPTFECQPYRYEVVPAAQMRGGSSLAGYNPRNAAAAPLISAAVTPGTVLTLRVSGCEDVIIETPEAEGDTLTVILDCDAQTVYTDGGVALGSVMLGDFPLIAPGDWTLEATGENGSVQSVSLLPRWRSL